MNRYEKIFQALFLYSVFMSCCIIAQYEEKKIVIVIPSYNNSRYYERNIQSVLSQNYTNFRVIYTDDCSSDGTGDLIEQFLTQHDKNHKVIVIKNKERRGALYNLYTMITSCDDDEIIVTLDGDDWLPDNEVLLRLNDVYSSGDIWLTYGQFQLHPSNIIGWASPMPDYIVEHNAFRDFQHLPTHLRTFYAWLFKKIKTEDLLYVGNFYPMTWDQVMMFPMIEMAGERHKFISDVMYMYNDENNISDHYVSRQLQAHLAQMVRGKKRYQRLAEKPVVHSQSTCADVVIFARTAPTLSLTLDSLFQYAQGIGSVFVMYKPMNEQEKDDYRTIQCMYSSVEFCQISEHRANFKEKLFTFYRSSKHEYILLLKDDMQFHRELSLSACIRLLQEVQAYAFYFKLTACDAMNHYKNLPLIECRPSIFAWNFSLGRDKWSCANSLDCVLHKKTASLSEVLQGYYDLTPNGLEMVWANEGNLDRLGLCFNESYVKLII